MFAQTTLVAEGTEETVQWPLRPATPEVPATPMTCPTAKPAELVTVKVITLGPVVIATAETLVEKAAPAPPVA